MKRRKNRSRATKSESEAKSLSIDPKAVSETKADVAESHDEPNPRRDGWIGVDLDGTLAFYDGWQGPEVIGPPVPSMLARVKIWLADGYHIKIVTARAGEPECIPPIKLWLRKHGLPDLEITNKKDFLMAELWDDRCVQVLHNTGKPVISPSILGRPKAPLQPDDKATPQPRQSALQPLPRRSNRSWWSKLWPWRGTGGKTATA